MPEDPLSRLRAADVRFLRITWCDNANVIRAKALPELQKQRTMILNQAVTQFKRQKADEAYIPVIKAAINRGLDGCG